MCQKWLWEIYIFSNLKHCIYIYLFCLLVRRGTPSLLFLCLFFFLYCFNDIVFFSYSFQCQDNDFTQNEPKQIYVTKIKEILYTRQLHSLSSIFIEIIVIWCGFIFNLCDAEYFKFLISGCKERGGGKGLG